MLHVFVELKKGSDTQFIADSKQNNITDAAEESQIHLQTPERHYCKTQIDITSFRPVTVTVGDYVKKQTT